MREYCGSITFMNMLGDITIVWDERNKDKVLEVIKKKMEQGYTFFTTKKFLFGTITRKGKITKRDLSRGKINEIVITDEQFEKMVQDMNDADVAELVTSDSASVVKRKGRSDIVAMKRAKTPDEVLESDSVAVRPIRGG